jgi:hypothetical protein
MKVVAERRRRSGEPTDKPYGNDDAKSIAMGEIGSL